MNKDIFGIERSDPTLIPLSPWLDRISRYQGASFTWKRTRATLNANVQLVRPGFELFDDLDRFTEWDDRGRVYATYKCQPGWNLEPKIFFKLDLVLKPNFKIKNLLKLTLQERATLRQISRYFKTKDFTIYLNISGTEVTDQTLLDYLAKPYDPHKDINLSSRPELFGEFLNIYSLGVVGKSMKNAATEKIFGREDVQQSKISALQK